MAAKHAVSILGLGALLVLGAGCGRESGGAQPCASAAPARGDEGPALVRAAPADEPKEIEADAPPALGAKAASQDDDGADDGEAAPPPKRSKEAAHKGKAGGASERRAPSTTRVASADGDDADKGDASEPAVASATLRVKRLEVATGVAGREPVGAAQSFSLSDDDKLYAFVELDNQARAATHVKVTFVPPKGSATSVKLKVGEAPRWRTWAKRSVGKARGTWQVVVRDDDGHEIGRKSFEVGAE